MRYAKYKRVSLITLPGVVYIPEHWNVMPLRYVMQNLDYLREPISADQRSRQSPKYDYYGASGVIDRIDYYNVDDTVLLIGEDGANLVYRNLPLIYRASGRFWVNNHAHILKPKCDDYGYMAYLMEAMDYFHLITGAAQPKLSQENLAKVRLLSPPLSEQRAISHYLDDKCGKIDELVAAKEKEVELLKELKQTVIADAVTGKGRMVNGKWRMENDSCRMKPSGIPWLPEIPEGWEVKKVRQIAKEGKCKNKGNVEKNVLSLSYGKIIRKKEIYSGLVPTDFATYQIVEKGYVVLRLTDLQNDHRSLRCGLVGERGIITSAYVSLIPGMILPEYLYLILHACDLHKVFYSLGGGLRQSMNYVDVGNLMIPLPPIQEQQVIAEYVAQKGDKFNLLIDELTQQVAALKEYKQRLIADVVTGQMRVA